MLLGYFMRTKNRATTVSEIFRKYMKSCGENMKITEQRALAVAPAKKTVLLNCFKLQYLLRERTTMRFKYLFTTNPMDCARFKSLGDIEMRLHQEWTEAEEAAIKAGNAQYCDVSREIDAIQSKWVPDSLTAPLRELMEDDIYRKESVAHADKMREFGRLIAQ
jgi:hypothetical protein